ncbi:MAG: YebC/PmpR family DNA-binding transcriptional regulator [Clostridia bacterium]|nr:YebC/PmpR family DNA-binding transcriptional regulator [Clostridia bacterium]MBQ6990783.1 YebC/PmpR family DNA-binding transcriptional regulator [Clostridia bacterium]MBR6762288.1 YebC/PmpR family DNA-binding transcriptional regulator [Clostridia bacterium]
MSGHSKWNNIKRKKEGTDAKKAAVFTRIGREMAIAIKEGGPDPVSNSKLRDIITKAKANNVPNDNIQRMLAKYTGGKNGNYENVTYEGYGPCGVALIVEATTDNRNRTASDVRHYFDKFGGNLGAQNSVSWQFERKGVIVIDREEFEDEEDDMMMIALDAGAEDFEASEESFEITTSVDALDEVCSNLEGQGYSFVVAEEQMIPQNTVALTDEDDIKKMQRLLEALEENDDVGNVWHNWEE